MLLLIPMSLLLPGFRAWLHGCRPPVPSDFNFSAPDELPPSGDVLQSAMREQISARIPLWCIESETNFSADSGTAADFFGVQTSLPRMSKEMSHWIRLLQNESDKAI
jgi:hypothetical protein